MFNVILECKNMEQKPKLFNLNNFIASETGRLTSLSIKRDLSLGGNKHKKVYKPNLNVVRNKNKPKVINIKVPDNHHKKNIRSLLNQISQNQRYVQTSSVFSEGANELKRPKIHSDRHLSSGERDQSSVAMPRISKMKWQLDLQEEESVLDELLAEDEDDSSSENEGDYSPIILPLKENKVGFLKTYQIKKEESNKLDIKEETSKSAYKINKNIRNVINYDLPLSFQDNKFYDEDHPCISVLKMPDSLPGKGFCEDSDKVVDFNLNQMIEGKIGKILVRKSGNVEVQIGNMKYVLDSVETTPFKEDLMFLSHDPKSTNFDMVNLGNIDEKYILSPSWKNLFELRNLKKK